MRAGTPEMEPPAASGSNRTESRAGELRLIADQTTKHEAGTGTLMAADGGVPAPPPEHNTRSQAAQSAVKSEMLTVEDVAAMLSIGVRSVWRKAQDGRLPPPIKMTGSTRWAKATLFDWITNQSTAANGQQGPSRRR